MTAVVFDGLDATALARRLRLPNVVVLARTTSTMDEAHERAARGAVAGTLIIAHAQTAGRGRSGGRWLGAEGTSILCTLVERPESGEMVGVLSLRVGLAVAAALDAFADSRVGLKWPNDLLVAGAKIAGVLIEARWREQRPEWVAMAIGLNIGSPPPEVPNGGGLRDGAVRLSVLDAIIPAMRGAARGGAALTSAELDDWRSRDWLDGRRITAPVAGVIGGILPTGELLINTPSGPAAMRSGTVKLEES
jgi:BirA family biotin operon repressor/biotin-[acetyl-CoA-carboxylase] ligase